MDMSFITTLLYSMALLISSIQGKTKWNKRAKRAVYWCVWISHSVLEVTKEPKGASLRVQKHSKHMFKRVDTIALEYS